MSDIHAFKSFSEKPLKLRPDTMQRICSGSIDATLPSLSARPEREVNELPFRNISKRDEGPGDRSGGDAGAGGTDGWLVRGGNTG